MIKKANAFDDFMGTVRKAEKASGREAHLPRLKDYIYNRGGALKPIRESADIRNYHKAVPGQARKIYEGRPKGVGTSPRQEAGFTKFTGNTGLSNKNPERIALLSQKIQQNKQNMKFNSVVSKDPKTKGLQFLTNGTHYNKVAAYEDFLIEKINREC